MTSIEYTEIMIFIIGFIHISNNWYYEQTNQGF